MGSGKDYICPAAGKKAPLNYTETINVVAGKQKTIFTVHKNEICSRSEFFRAACSERWNATTAGGMISVELLDEDPYVVDAYLHCVYKNAVDIGDKDVALPTEDEVPSDEWIENRLCKAYILADKLRDVVSANRFIDCLIGFYMDNNICASHHVVNMIASNTAAESPLYKFMLDLVANTAATSTIRCICEHADMPRHFINDVLIRRTEKLEKNLRLKGSEIFDTHFLHKQSMCLYHQHDDLHPAGGEGCEKKPETGAEGRQ